jgi:DNA-directed RNA polymerase specialized sigma subunit, sigma54 homolog
MTTLELKEYLETQLVENPVLEEVEEKAPESEDPSDNGEEEEFDFKLIEDGLFRNNDENSSSFGDFSGEHEEEVPWESRVSSTESLLDHLNWQLSLSDFSDEEKHIASLIIGNTNEDGYLELEVKEVALQLLSREFESNLDWALKNDTGRRQKRVL